MKANTENAFPATHDARKPDPRREPVDCLIANLSEIQVTGAIDLELMALEPRHRLDIVRRREWRRIVAEVCGVLAARPPAPPTVSAFRWAAVLLALAVVALRHLIAS